MTTTLLKNRHKPLFINNILIVLFIIFNNSIVTAQVKPLDSVIAILDRNGIEELNEIVNSTDFESLNQEDRGYYLLATGGIKFAVDDFENAYQDLIKSKEKHNNKRISFKANDLMILMSTENSELTAAPESLMSENLEIAQKLNDSKLLVKAKHQFMYKEIQLGNFDTAIAMCYEMKKLCEDNGYEQEGIDVDFNLGTLHYYRQANDSALYYYERNLAVFERRKDTFNIAVRLNNLAMLQKAIGQEKEAVNNLIKAEKLAQDLHDKELSVNLLRNIADAQVAAGNLGGAIEYYNEYISEKDSLNTTEIASSLAELQTKYETTEKELENAELKSKNLNSRNKIYLLLFILATLVGIGAYLFNRMKQKQALLAATAETHKQRQEKLLKNQELASIDAMISGQEKERKKIAQDLHDDIGSSLTTARMCIENVINKSNEEESKKVLENAYDLLNETYIKVRNISHAQKSSVLSSYGLIGSLKELADRINAGQSLNVEIVHHGLEGALSNSLELGLFRIIQELLNNTIKHAHAKHASIILTAYDDHINIIVEDDGSGFSPDMIDSEGTGLNSIKTRVINLDGTMEIDSKLNRGTTISIEIPLI